MLLFSCHVWLFCVLLDCGTGRWLFYRHLTMHSFTLFCAVLCLVSLSGLTLCNAMDCSPPESPVHGDSPGKNTGVGCYALLQGIFPTQGSKPGLQHCRWILYLLSHQGSPRILKWVAHPFYRGSLQPRNWTKACIAGRFFASWATREAPLSSPASVKYVCSHVVLFLTLYIVKVFPAQWMLL